MKKSRLEPFEILTANRRRNPLIAPPEATTPAETAEDVSNPVPEASEPEPPARSAKQSPAKVSRWSRIRGYTLLTVRVTPLVVALVSLLISVIVGASFWRGYRAGSAEWQLPEQAPAGSLEEIRRNRIVLFDDLEVDRGRLRR